jgi:hypothetical protein
MHSPDDPQSYRIHQLPEFEDAGYSPSYEYFLPVRNVLEADLAPLGPWLQAVARGDADAAKRALEERWQQYRHDPFRDLIEYYLAFQPNGVVIHDQKAWLLCFRSETAFSEGTMYLLPEPVDDHNVRTRLSNCGFRDDLLTQFLCAFSGIREDFFPSAGYFVEGAGEWRLIGSDDEAWEAEFEKTVAGYTEWHGALHFYHSRSSDTLLVHPTGKVGWWVGDDLKIVEYAPSFADFCALYTRFRNHAWKRLTTAGKLFAWPYDYYSSKEF